MFENIKADIGRFRHNGDEGQRATLRDVVRGLLSQGFQALLVYRMFRWLHLRKIPTQPFRLIVERITEIMTGISIPAEVEIGRGLRIHHFGGIILHPHTVVGENCTLYQGVTLGDKGGYGGAPVIGNHVLIGAGAKILGHVEIGDHAVIGANSVVTKSVPEHAVAVGVPAEIVKIQHKEPA